MKQQPNIATVQTWRERFGTNARLPAQGKPREAVLEEIRAMAEREAERWRAGFASGAVYHGDREHIEFLNRAYALESQSNPLHVDLWPSTVKMEAEIVSMTAHMLGAGALGHEPGTPEGVCGTLSSGGSESIQLAMRTYRDYFRSKKNITAPEMVIPASAHVAFEKAAQYFQIKPVIVPVQDDMRANADAMRAAITENTIVVVGSAPSFPYGQIDPIEELSELAFERGIGFHTDACLGGFVLPFAEKLGYPVPRFDFRLRGVTSMSCDTHKFGYAAKGTSVVLYRGAELRRFQYFTSTEWCGGLYASPSFAGSRPGGLSAACWAALTSIGEAGYLEAARRILGAADHLKAELAGIPELRLIGAPLFVLGLQSSSADIDIFRVLDAMTERGWSLNGLHRPAGLHICVTLRHTEPGVAARFIADLREAVEQVKNSPHASGGMAPIYGMANSLPDRGVVADALAEHMDGWYRVE
ncbi:MAG TPA: aminotransferase class V-fold PLP-dependent enzyme [Polyangiaceae bacterium]|nr:aminotransferase class V-fold PLP-dependent enzyme [Polyangiaceae bacterium]